MSAITVAAAIDLLISLLAKTTEISQVIATARAAGRETLTPQEWQSILTADDVARRRLLETIMQAANAVPPAP